MNMLGLSSKDKDKEKEQAAAAENAAAEEKKDEGATAEGNTVVTMKRGDYMIHVLIEQAKNIKVESGATVDPIVEVSCLGEKKYTSAQDDIDASGVAMWNEHIFFEPKNCEKEKLEKGKIEIKLLDKGFLKDVLIGYYEFDLSYIYLRKDHALMHKWLIMSNPESEDFSEVTGYLKISITVCGEGDEQVSIEDDPNPNEDDVLQPPQIQPEFYQFKVRFFQAQKIVPMDSSTFGKGSTDAYVSCFYKGTKLSTKVIEQPEDGFVDWNEEFLIPCQVPIMGGRVVFGVYDEDVVSDELIGTTMVQMKKYIGKKAINTPDENGKIIPQLNYRDDFAPGLTDEELDAARNSKNGRFFWKNLYGAPLGTSGEHAKNMNNNPELGSLWKGRILMQVVCEKTDKPVRRVQPIPQEFIELSKQYLVNKQYKFMFQIFSSIALPEENEKYEVVVKIAEKEISTGGPVFAKGCYNRYNFRNDPDQGSIVAPYVNIYDIGTIFVYLRKKGTFGKEKNICFYRASISEFLTKEPEFIKWVELQPDLALGAVKESHKAGLVGIKMYLHDELKSGPIDFKKEPYWSKKIPRRPGNFKVRAYIFQCRDLPAADSDGASDPFCKLIDSDVVKKTKIIYDNLNPIFYQAIDLVYEANTEDEIPPFIIDIYDHDEAIIGSDGEDYLGRVVIRREECHSTASDAIARPKWHPVKYDSKSPTCGELLISFSIVEDDYLFKKKVNQVALHEQVVMKEFQVSLNVLGMRGLESPGILPVKKAFVKFNLKSLVPPSIGTDLQNLMTEPKAPGPNPTISTLMSFHVPLPIEDLYCPRLSCQVFDCIYAGFSQPLIGNFVIPVGDLMHDLKRERDTEIEALKQMVNKLDAIADEEEVATNLYESQRQQKQQELLSAGASEEEIAKVRPSAEEKKKMLKSFADLRKSQVGGTVDQDGSLNMSSDVTGQLLTGDSNEELRMADRLAEKKENAKEGKMKRVTVEDITVEKCSPTNQFLEQAFNLQIDENNGGRLSVARPSQRRKTTKLGAASPKFQEVNFALKQELMRKEKERQEKAKRDAEDERQRELAEAKQQGFSTSKNIVMPKYELDDYLQVDKEVGKPPESIFIGLGWDEDKDTKRKHYRRYYPDELENIKDILPITSPFQSYDIKRGQSRGAPTSFFGSLFGGAKTDASGQVSTDQVMGKFKAVIEVEVVEEKEAYMREKERLFQEMQECLKRLATLREMPNFELDLDKLETIEGREELEMQMEPFGIRGLKITKVLADIQSDVILQRMLLQQKQCIIRVYMISGYDLASRDIGGFSDPYLRLSVGDQVHDERDNYVLDEPKPYFGKHYDFTSVFPGCPPLKIEVMDYDDLFGDDLIGTTTVDLEDRYFLAEWRAIEDKPVEFRQIYHPSSNASQGVLKMWVEILPAKVAPEDEEPIWDITRKPPQDFEVRVVVWDTKEIIPMDFEGTSDVFIKAFFDNKNPLETDCHYRCQDGKASFNWRLLFNLQLPRNDYRLTFQAFDRDFFASNDIIGSCMIDLKQAMEDAELTKRPLAINKKYFEKAMKSDTVDFEWKDDSSFWLPMKGKNKDGQFENNGFVRVAIEIVPRDYAEKNPVGAAREEPNANPFLPPPVGRLSFSLNPIKMFNQLVGPALRRKIYCYCCLGICAILCVYMIIFIVPSLIGALLASAFQ